MVTYRYARTVEDRVNSYLAQGKIAEAQMQAANITSGGRGVNNAVARITRAISSAQAAAYPAQRPAPAPAPPSGGNPNPGGGNPQPTFDYGAWRAEQDRIEAAQREQQRINQALAAAKGFFETYGMMGLWNGVEALVRAGYNDADTISGILSRDSK